MYLKWNKTVKMKEKANRKCVLNVGTLHRVDEEHNRECFVLIYALCL